MKKRINFRMNAKVISTLVFSVLSPFHVPSSTTAFNMLSISPLLSIRPSPFLWCFCILSCLFYILLMFIILFFCNLNQYSSRIFWLEPTCSWYSPSDCITCFLVEPAWLFRLSSRLSAWQRTPEINLHSCAFNFLYSK